jgi:DNA-binding NtrC family response regulator
MDQNNKPVKLLLVDDEEDFLESASAALGRRDFDVRVARDGTTALDMAGHESFDAIVLDLKMPGLDGVEVFRRLLESSPGTPVLMLTGHGSIDSAFQTSRSGIADYIEKPCDIEDLARRIRTALATRSQCSEAERQRLIDDIRRKYPD